MFAEHRRNTTYVLFSISFIFQPFYHVGASKVAGKPKASSPVLFQNPDDIESVSVNIHWTDDDALPDPSADDVVFRLGDNDESEGVQGSAIGIRNGPVIISINAEGTNGTILYKGQSRSVISDSQDHYASMAIMMIDQQKKKIKPENDSNAAPVITSMQLYPIAVRPGMASTATVEAYDPEGHSLNFNLTFGDDPNSLARYANIEPPNSLCFNNTEGRCSVQYTPDPPAAYRNIKYSVPVSWVISDPYGANTGITSALTVRPSGDIKFQLIFNKHPEIITFSAQRYHTSSSDFTSNDDLPITQVFVTVRDQDFKQGFNWQISSGRLAPFNVGRLLSCSNQTFYPSSGRIKSSDNLGASISFTLNWDPYSSSNLEVSDITACWVMLTVTDDAGGKVSSRFSVTARSVSPVINDYGPEFGVTWWNSNCPSRHTMLKSGITVYDRDGTGFTLKILYGTVGHLNPGDIAEWTFPPGNCTVEHPCHCLFNLNASGIGGNIAMVLKEIGVFEPKERHQIKKISSATFHKLRRNIQDAAESPESIILAVTLGDNSVNAGISFRPKSYKKVQDQKRLSSTPIPTSQSFTNKLISSTGSPKHKSSLSTPRPITFSAGKIITKAPMSIDTTKSSVEYTRSSFQASAYSAQGSKDDLTITIVAVLAAVIGGYILANIVFILYKKNVAKKKRNVEETLEQEHNVEDPFSVVEDESSKQNKKRSVLEPLPKEATVPALLKLKHRSEIIDPFKPKPSLLPPIRYVVDRRKRKIFPSLDSKTSNKALSIKNRRKLQSKINPKRKAQQQKLQTPSPLIVKLDSGSGNQMPLTKSNFDTNLSPISKFSTDIYALQENTGEEPLENISTHRHDGQSHDDERKSVEHEPKIVESRNLTKFLFSSEHFTHSESKTFEKAISSERTGNCDSNSTRLDPFARTPSREITRLASTATYGGQVYSSPRNHIQSRAKKEINKVNEVEEITDIQSNSSQTNENAFLGKVPSLILPDEDIKSDLGSKEEGENFEKFIENDVYYAPNSTLSPPPSDSFTRQLTPISKHIENMQICRNRQINAHDKLITFRKENSKKRLQKILKKRAKEDLQDKNRDKGVKRRRRTSFFPYFKSSGRRASSLSSDGREPDFIDETIATTNSSKESFNRSLISSWWRRPSNITNTRQSVTQNTLSKKENSDVRGCTTILPIFISEDGKSDSEGDISDKEKTPENNNASAKGSDTAKSSSEFLSPVSPAWWRRFSSSHEKDDEDEDQCQDRQRSNRLLSPASLNSADVRTQLFNDVDDLFSPRQEDLSNNVPNEDRSFKRRPPRKSTLWWRRGSSSTDSTDGMQRSLSGCSRASVSSKHSVRSPRTSTFWWHQQTSTTSSTDNMQRNLSSTSIVSSQQSKSDRRSPRISTLWWRRGSSTAGSAKDISRNACGSNTKCLQSPENSSATRAFRTSMLWWRQPSSNISSTNTPEKPDSDVFLDHDKIIRGALREADNGVKEAARAIAADQKAARTALAIQLRNREHKAKNTIKNKQDFEDELARSEDTTGAINEDSLNKDD